MSGEGKLDKRLVSFRVAIETCIKAEAKYRHEGDKSWRESLVRALEDATRDYQLTPDDYRAIADEIERNTAKREEGRNHA